MLVSNKNLNKLHIFKLSYLPKTVDASDWSYYRSGLFTARDMYDINHAVNLVGYGKHSTSGQEYWKIRNSWGTG